MPLHQAILLALVQALTEFLPISSTAHLFLVGWLFGWGDSGLSFAIAVHAGSLLGVLAYFYRTWIRLLRAVLGRPAPEHTAEVVADRKLFWLLVLGTVPAALAGLLLEEYVATVFRSERLMAGTLIGFGLLLGWADHTGRRRRQMDSLSTVDALWIGVAQAVALVPGVSRSGFTITTGLLRGLTREAAARFTFLLSTPIIAGATLVHCLELQHTPPNSADLTAQLAGALVSALASFLVIKYFLRFLQTRSLKVFVYYRIVFGIVILLLSFLQTGSAR
jgi:undecaprenyl-diphosphatase